MSLNNFEICWDFISIFSFTCPSMEKKKDFWSIEILKKLRFSDFEIFWDFNILKYFEIFWKKWDFEILKFFGHHFFFFISIEKIFLGEISIWIFFEHYFMTKSSFFYFSIFSLSKISAQICQICRTLNYDITLHTYRTLNYDTTLHTYRTLNFNTIFYQIRPQLKIFRFVEH